MEYLAQCVAVAEGKRSGLPLGTRPDSVTRAKSILLGSLRGGGGDDLERFDGEFAGIWFAAPFLQRHGHGPCGCRRARPHRATDRPWEEAFFCGGAQRQPTSTLNRQLGHALQSRLIPTVLAAVAMM